MWRVLMLVSVMLWLWMGMLEAATTVYRGCVLGWDPNTEPDLASYRVYTHQLGGVYTSTFTPVTPPTTTVSCATLGLTQGRYNVRITAVDTATPPNESSVSNELDLDVLVPVRAR